MPMFLYQFGPAAAGLILALGVWVLRRPPMGALPKPVRLLTGVAMALGLGCMIVVAAWSVYPWWVPPMSTDTLLWIRLAQFLAPLVVCAAVLVFLILPPPASGPRGTAALAPRTPMSFTSRPWLATVAGLIVASVAIAVLAGAASSPDENGRYVSYVLRTSTDSSAATTTYGWWFSVPALILLAVIALLVATGLVVISRPALAVESSLDAAARSRRIRTTLMVAAGGILLHLATVLQALQGTSSLQAGLVAGYAGVMELGTSFAALGPALGWGSLIAFVVGIALWWSVLLSLVPARRRQVSHAGRSVPA